MLISCDDTGFSRTLNGLPAFRLTPYAVTANLYEVPFMKKSFTPVGYAFEVKVITLEILLSLPKAVGLYSSCVVPLG